MILNGAISLQKSGRNNVGNNVGDPNTLPPSHPLNLTPADPPSNTHQTNQTSRTHTSTPLDQAGVLVNALGINVPEGEVKETSSKMKRTSSTLLEGARTGIGIVIDRLVMDLLSRTPPPSPR